MATGGADASGQTSAGLGARDEGLEASATLGVLALLRRGLHQVGRGGQQRAADARTGATVGIGRAFLRQVVWALLALPCYLGYITYFTDSSGRNRALHEQAAATVTVAVPRVGLFRSIADAVRSLRP